MAVMAYRAVCAHCKAEQFVNTHKDWRAIVQWLVKEGWLQRGARWYCPPCVKNNQQFT